MEAVIWSTERLSLVQDIEEIRREAGRPIRQDSPAWKLFQDLMSREVNERRPLDAEERLKVDDAIETLSRGAE